MKRCLAALALVCAPPAGAAGVSPRPDSITLTIYHDYQEDTAGLARDSADKYILQSGIAFITETRRVEIPAGDSTIEFRGVASTIVPQTADINGLPAGILERNFDYDLLSPGSLLAKSVGQTVTLVRTDPATGKRSEQVAVVRSAPNGTMLDINGKFEALKCSGLPEKLVFTKTPDGLHDTPTLSVRTHAAKSGRYTVKLSYIATGIYWSADYVARIRPDGHSLDLSGFITLSNFSSTSFPNIPVEVVAGNVGETGEDSPVDSAQPHVEETCWPTNIDWATRMLRIVSAVGQQEIRPPPPPPAPGQGGPVETVVVTGSRIPSSTLGDYKLYALPERTSVAARETKQVQFLDQRDVQFERVYAYYVDESEREVSAPADAFLRLQNKKAEGLGLPLPGGTVSVEEQGPTGPLLAGQANFTDKSEGLPVEIDFTDAINVRVRQRITEHRTIGSGKLKVSQDDFEIAVENDKPVAIAFELGQPLYETGMRVVAEDAAHTIEPGGAFWHFTLKPGEVRLVHYTIESPADS